MPCEVPILSLTIRFGYFGSEQVSAGQGAETPISGSVVEVREQAARRLDGGG